MSLAKAMEDQTDFFTLGMRIIYGESKSALHFSANIVKFKSFYGASPQVCKSIWNLLKPNNCDFEANHMLWGLLLLKCYNTEAVNAALIKTSEKTFRKWAWKSIHAISRLNIVRI